MANDKKSFILYSDQRGIFEKLSDEQAGKLIKHIYKYVNDEEPVGDFTTELAFELIRTQLARDLEKWHKQREQRSLAGKASAKSRQRKSTSVNDRQRKPTVTVNDNVTVNVNDNVNAINIDTSFEKWWNLYDKKIGKSKTLQKWQRLKDEERDKCLEVVKDYVKATPDKKYRKHPLTYLNGSHWEDEISVKKKLSEYEKLIKGWR